MNSTKINTMKTNNHYSELLQDIKASIAASRYAAARMVNKEQLKLYFNIGRLLDEKITSQKWGEKVLLQISSDLNSEMPNLRGFSHRSLKKMRQFYTAYANQSIGPLLTAQLQGIDNVIATTALQYMNTEDVSVVPASVTLEEKLLDSFFGVTFTHHVLLLAKCHLYEERLYYMHRAATEFWTVNTLEHYIKEGLFKQAGKLNHNFDTTIDTDIGSNANVFFKDRYLLDFLQLQDSDAERKIENSIVSNITEFILKMGQGFAFIGNQFRLEVEGHEFSIDLLFYNRILRRLVAFELKKDRFKPEYTGQLHFYLNVLDDKIKLKDELPSIGIILCKEKQDAIVQYSIRNLNTPMGVATFTNTNEPPAEIQQVLPDSDQLRRLL